VSYPVHRECAIRVSTCEWCDALFGLVLHERERKFSAAS
jgi:hypothetical protein